MPPEVSVIVPVFNNSAELGRCLAALEEQTLSRGSFEIIVVDNGSTDDTLSVARSHSGVIALQELTHLRSPYSARNRGLEASSGEVVAFVDATCVPDRYWLQAALECLREFRHDAIAGAVDFAVSENSSTAEIYDSLVNIRMRESVMVRKVAKTANLVCRAQVIERIGPFPEGIRSGGDVEWTHRIGVAGMSLGYCPEAKVRKLPRGFVELVRKQLRTSLAHPRIWASIGARHTVLRVLKGFIPVSPMAVRRLVTERGEQWMMRRLWRLWALHNTIRFLMACGSAVGLLSLPFKPAVARQPAGG
jgi:glycosyltransferase AglE